MNGPDYDWTKSNFGASFRWRKSCSNKGSEIDRTESIDISAVAPTHCLQQLSSLELIFKERIFFFSFTYFPCYLLIARLLFFVIRIYSLLGGKVCPLYEFIKTKNN